MLNLAAISGDIEGKTVADFGCGSGKLGIGAALLGAKKVVMIDIDEMMIKLAKENSEAAGVLEAIEFVNSDIESFSGHCDTIVQNPPFGMRGKLRSDRVFLKKAVECLEAGGRIYSLHRGGYDGEGGNEKTRKFIERFVGDNGGRVLTISELRFDIPKMFKFHKKPKVSYNVDLFVIEKS
jgi:putative methylase